LARFFQNPESQIQKSDCRWLLINYDFVEVAAFQAFRLRLDRRNSVALALLMYVPTEGVMLLGVATKKRAISGTNQ